MVRTVVIPPLQRFEVNEFKARHQVCGSRTASHAWFHLNFPLSITPVLSLIVRCTAIALSLERRNIAFAGVSGNKAKRMNA